MVRTYFYLLMGGQIESVPGHPNPDPAGMLAAPDSVHRIPAARSGENKVSVTGIDRRQAVSLVAVPLGLHGPLRKNPHSGDAQKLTAQQSLGTRCAAPISSADKTRARPARILGVPISVVVTSRERPAPNYGERNEQTTQTRKRNPRLGRWR